jgi:hypothetical protein
VVLSFARECSYMLTVKGIVQPYVQKLIERIFNPRSVPTAVRALFAYIDRKAGEAGTSDPDVAHIWKNYSLPLRFYVNLIKNPSFVFDGDTPPMAASNLSVIAQVLMDSCSVAEQHLTVSGCFAALSTPSPCPPPSPLPSSSLFCDPFVSRFFSSVRPLVDFPLVRSCGGSSFRSVQVKCRSILSPFYVHFGSESLSFSCFWVHLAIYGPI